MQGHPRCGQPPSPPLLAAWPDCSPPRCLPCCLAGCRDCSTLMAHKKGTEGLPGIVSCMAPNPDRSGMLAVGSYSGGSALLDARSRELLCLLEGGHSGGLTHVSPSCLQPLSRLSFSLGVALQPTQPRLHCTAPTMHRTALHCHCRACLTVPTPLLSAETCLASPFPPSPPLPTTPCSSASQRMETSCTPGPARMQPSAAGMCATAQVRLRLWW